MVGKTISHFKITEKHPAELDFHKMLEEVKSFLEKFEDKFVDGDEKEVLMIELKKIKERLFDLQMGRFAKYINDRGKVENMPVEEEKIQREMTDLITRINKFLHAD